MADHDLLRTLRDPPTDPEIIKYNELAAACDNLQEILLRFGKTFRPAFLLATQNEFHAAEVAFARHIARMEKTDLYWWADSGGCHRKDEKPPTRTTLGALAYKLRIKVPDQLKDLVVLLRDEKD